MYSDVEIDYPYESMNQSVAPDSFASEVESEEPEEPEEEYEEPPRLPSHNIIDILPTQAPPKSKIHYLLTTQLI